MLQAQDIIAGYVPEVDVLNGCNLRLEQKEIVGIIGPNGAGKSTLLKSIFGLVTVRRGSIIFKGQDITGLAPHRLVRQGLGYVPQLANTFLPLTVHENIRMGSWVNKRIDPGRREEIFELFPKLKERWDQQVWQMSGGERQMVAMSRALIAGPEVILLDEPSAGLSPANQAAVFENIWRVRETGISILIVEQNARACLEICDRAYVLDQGVDVFEGRSQELLDDEKVQKLFLGSLIGH